MQEKQMVNLRANVQGLKLSQDGRDTPETVKTTATRSQYQRTLQDLTEDTCVAVHDIVYLTRTSMFYSIHAVYKQFQIMFMNSVAMDTS